jgi:hypothetical protein
MGVIEPVIARAGRVYRNSLWAAMERFRPLQPPNQDDIASAIVASTHLVHHGLKTLDGTAGKLIKTIATDVLEEVELLAKTQITTGDAQEFASVVDDLHAVVMYPQPDREVVESINTL